MRMSLTASAIALLALGCANNGDGFIVSGSVQTAFTDGTSAPQETRFAFPAQTRIDPTLPSGAADGFVGRCSVGPEGRTLRIQRVGGTAGGLESVSVSMPDWSQDQCASCAHGTATFAVNGVTFTGSEQRGAADNACTFTATRVGSYGMNVTTRCSAITASGKSATLNLELSLDQCDGPETQAR